MRKDVLNKAGLAALILLAPGGFILGATLVARHYRRKSRQGTAADSDDATETGGTDIGHSPNAVTDQA